MLSHRIPYPPDKGDKIRSWRILKHLSERYAVHLGCFIDTPEDRQWCDTVKEVCATTKFVTLRPNMAKARSLSAIATGAPQSLAYYSSHDMRHYVTKVRERALAFECVFSTPMAQYIAKPENDPTRIVDLCDADSAKWAQYADETPGLKAMLFRREAATLMRYERDVVEWADAAIAISRAEAAVLDGGSGKAVWFGNGVDTDFFDPGLPFDSSAPALSGADRPAEIVFIGAMDYKPNVDAAVWFAEKCWPQIRAAAPGAQFAIVGANPVHSVRALQERDGVIVTGRVHDVRPFLADAKVAIAPLRIARGVQNKVLEAMAMALPVVASEGAIEGLDIDAGTDCIVARNADSFTDAVLTALRDEEKARSLGAHARRKVMRDYSWAGQLARFDGIIRRARTRGANA